MDGDRSEPGARPMAEIGDDFLRELIRKAHAPPLVKRLDAFFEFYREGVMVYDVRVWNLLDALRLILHLSEKSWFTLQHVEQFTLLAADMFDAEFR